MKIATLGDINIDVVLPVDHLPTPGEEVFSSNRSELLGGSAVNTAVVLARLGQDVAVMGAVGSDDAGSRALRDLEDLGVSTVLTARTTRHPTAMNTILVTPDGERTMIGARGANVSYRNVSGWNHDLDWLHVSGYALMEGVQSQSAVKAIEWSQHHGVRCSLDVPSGVGSEVREIIGELLGSFTVVAGSHTSLGEITQSDTPVENLIDLGVSRVAQTSGANPLVLAEQAARITLTPPLVNPIDATGAGDALVAGLITATVSGLGIGPSAVLAAASGAAATLVVGASQTLSDPDSWGSLLQPDLWVDAQAGWLDEAARIVQVDSPQGKSA